MATDLFAGHGLETAPLAHRMRPRSFDEFVGQEHLLGPGKILAELLQTEFLPSLILWGPPGSGKTTVAHLFAQKKGCDFIPLSAVTSGIKEVREVIAKAEEDLKFYRKKTLLFIDEIHRFNKAQQDALLPHIEKGTVTLIGATTENPSFEVIAPLLSRCRVLVLNRLSEGDLKKILSRGLAQLNLEIEPEAEALLVGMSEGDGRRMLNALEIAVEIVTKEEKTGIRKQEDPVSITAVHVETAFQKRSLIYDKSGEEHYNVISAFIKSMRDSDPDAAIYYLARMLVAGEDPLFIARRMVIFASEDVGNADPQAVRVAVSCLQSYDFVGEAEGWIPLAQCASYLAGAPKSNASYAAYLSASEDVKKYGSLPVPLHLRNAPTQLMKDEGYGKGYRYAHDTEDRIVVQQHLPDALKDKKYYFPTAIGYEARMKEWLTKVESRKKNP